MPSRSLKRAVLTPLTILLAVLVTASCAVTIRGHASFSSGGLKEDAPPSDLKIEYSDGGEVDQLVANSVDDIMHYWDEQFPEVFGKDLEPLEGGIYSMTPTENREVPCGPGISGQEIENNAFYCIPDDLIAYDRNFAEMLGDEYGDLLVTLILAHEAGHFVQSRTTGFNDKGIAIETQADCYAGAFVKEAEKGTTHFKVTRADLDGVLSGYLLFRTQPGGSPDDPNAHGSGFDRIAAFQEGFNEGPEHCKDAFGPDRTYTQIPYQDKNDAANMGNASYEQSLQFAENEMQLFAETIVDDQQGTWDNVPAVGYQGSKGECDGEKQNAQVFYCAEDQTVYYSEALTKKAYNQYGDYAVMQLMGLAYGDAIQDAIDSKNKSGKKFKASLCMTGAYAGSAFALTLAGKPTKGGLILSAGDLDEAVAVLIGLGEANTVVNTYQVDAFGRVDVLREGYGLGEDGETNAVQCLNQ